MSSVTPASSYAIVEAILVGLVVLWAAWFAWRKFFPRTYRAALAWLAARLSASQNARWRRIGARLMPRQVAGGGGCGSGGGCAACGNCAPSASSASPLPNAVRPLMFHPRVKRRGPQ